MTYSEIIIQRILSQCNKRRISVNKLSQMSGVKQSTLDNIVRGITKDPRLTTIPKIAIAFNMTLAEFLDFDALNEFAFEKEE